MARLGFYGRQGEKLWARSGVESLHLWEWAAACNDEAAGARTGRGRWQPLGGGPEASSLSMLQAAVCLLQGSGYRAHTRVAGACRAWHET